MAISEETTRQLLWHAGLPLEVYQPGTCSIAACSYPATVDLRAFEEAVADFVCTLSVLNHEVNGFLPSESVVSDRDSISLTVVFAIARSIGMIRSFEDRATSYARRIAARAGARRADTAWQAVLDGDIDDVEEHVGLQEWARFEPTDELVVWIFNGARARLPSGAFDSRRAAESWISRHRLSGVLTAYPVDRGVYEWTIERGYFEPRPGDQRTPEFIQRFSSAHLIHVHYEDGTAVSE